MRNPVFWFLVLSNLFFSIAAISPTSQTPRWLSREGHLEMLCTGNKLQDCPQSPIIWPTIPLHINPNKCKINRGWESIAKCTQLEGAKVGKKVSVFQISGICAVIAGCCFWSQRGRGRSRWLILLHFPSLLPTPLPQAEMTSKGFKRPVLFARSSFFSFPFLGTRH